MKLYRFDNPSILGYNIRLREFDVLSETSKGFWIDAKDIIEYPYYKNNIFDELNKPKKKWVSKDGLRRYAHDTIEGALIAFKYRKRMQIRILESKLRKARYAYNDSIYAENNPDYINIKFIKKSIRLSPKKEQDIMSGFIKEEDFII